MTQKHWIIIGGVVVFLGLGGWISYLNQRVIERESEIAALETTRLTMDNEQQELKNTINDITGKINDISGKLEDVRNKHVKMAVLANKPGVEQKQKAQMIDDLLAIEGQLKQDRKDIDNLNKRMSQSGLKIKSLEEMVANLKSELEQNVASMASLRATIAAKDADLVRVREKLTQTNVALEDTKQDLKETQQNLYNTQSTGYFIIGVKDTLKNQNVLVEEGRFFFQKKTLHLANSLDNSRFTKIDINQQTEFTIDCKAEDVKIVPDRGAEFYTLENGGDYKTTLRIKNPAQFWRIPYLAIVVKG